MEKDTLSQFHLAMLGIYDAALKLKPTYRATSFLKMVNEHGGKETADRLLATGKPSQGFTELFLRGKDNLKLSVEYLVLQSPWRTLFSPDQLGIARTRLMQVGCPLPPQDTADKTSGNAFTSLLRAYAQEQATIIVDQYEEGLCELLNTLDSNGFNTADLQKRLTVALGDKDTGGYVNLACELAAAGYFLKHFPDGFLYQVPSAEPSSTGMSKNFDFAFVANGFSFHVEVKAFASNPKANQGPPIKVFLPRDQQQSLYEQGLRFSRHSAPAISRFLNDANSQLTSPPNGLSVMLLCCNDLDEFSDALTCFVGPHGICNQTEQQGLVPAPSQLPNIDAVIICQLGFNQSSVLDPVKFKSFFGENDINITHGGAAWDYKTSIPVGLFLRKELPSHDLQVAFQEVFRSSHANIAFLMQQNGYDIQQALFALFNEAHNRK